IHASYGGDGNFAGSTASDVMLTVNPPTVTPAADLRVTVSLAAPNPVLPGQPYRYTITVSNIGTLNATNVVLVDAVARGVKPLTVNSARVIGKTFGIQSPGFLMRLSSLRAGTSATLTVSESAAQSGRFTDSIRVMADQQDPTPGDNLLSITETVNHDATATAVSAAPASSVLGQPVTFTARVTAKTSGSGTPTGTVDFVDTTTGARLGSKPLTGGSAILTSSALIVGSHTVTATYSGDADFTGSSSTASSQVSAPPPPSVSVAIGPNGQVMEVVYPNGTLTQFDASGAHVLMAGVRSASVAFSPSGEVVLVVFQDGTLTQFDATGAHPLGALGGGVRSASLAFGPAGEVVDMVFQDGTLNQFDATGIHAIASGVRSAAVAFSAAGQVLDVVFQDGTLTQFDAAGAHPLMGGVLSAGVAFGRSGEVLEVIFQDGMLTQFDATGVHPLFKVF
ncbi:MAG TPA: Ig-like domain repeat protein, partial [Gemmataceae bacterium]|nr:Ig-like domain repeat protein [Gemmataceae bacterium]